MKQRSIALLGCGTVGRGLVELIRKNRALIAERSGVDLTISKILVRDMGKDRGDVDRSLLTCRPEEVITNGSDVVVELIGGIEPARTFIARAIGEGKNVVTANKAVLAHSGAELFRAAAARNVRIGFEASVGGGIPIVRALTCGLVGDRILEISGIVNGTCNYILTRMAEEKLSFAQALAAAQKEGFAEADPSLDIDGIDAAQKLEILAELAFGLQLDPGRVRVQGIRDIDLEDLQSAEALGYVVKHVAIAKDLGRELDLRVHPAFLPKNHPLAHVRHEFNAVRLKGDAVGEMIFHGKGAGGSPTASAVLSDIIDLVKGDTGPVHLPEPVEKPVAPDIESEYYLRFPILDVPGVIGLIATALGNRGVSISHASATLVRGAPDKGSVKILAHRCRESVLRKSVDEIARLPVLTGKPVVLRILEEVT
ncbi:MAG: homoserine dehydrogenase [Planctomycetes bacterium]|nr:homoserine dehydrogenase [Planctomycetota bacterium]